MRIKLHYFLFQLTLAATLGACSTATHQIADGTEAVRPPGLAAAGLYAASQPEHFAQQCTSALEGLGTALEGLAGQDTLALNYLRQVDEFLVDLDNSYNIAQLYAQVHPEPAMRESAANCQQALSNLFTEFTLSAGIFERLQQLDSTAARSDTRRFHTQLLRDYRRAGVDQSAATREQIRALNEQITALGQAFSKHIREDVRSVRVTERSQLAGMPQDYIDALQRDGNDWLISTDYPEIFPLLSYAHNDALRKRIYIEFLNRGYPDNDETLLQIIQLREQLAQ